MSSNESTQVHAKGASNVKSARQESQRASVIKSQNANQHSHDVSLHGSHKKNEEDLLLLNSGAKQQHSNTKQHHSHTKDDQDSQQFHKIFLENTPNRKSSVNLQPLHHNNSNSDDEGEKPLITDSQLAQEEVGRDTPKKKVNKRGGSAKKAREAKQAKGQVIFKCFNKFCQFNSDTIHSVVIKCNAPTDGKEFQDPNYKQFKAYEWAVQQFQLKEPLNTENFPAYLCEQCKGFFDKGFICYYCKQVYAEEFDMDQMGWVQCDGNNCGKWVHTYEVGLYKPEKYKNFDQDQNTEYKCASCTDKKFKNRNKKKVVKTVAQKDYMERSRAAKAVHKKESIEQIEEPQPDPQVETFVPNNNNWNTTQRTINQPDDKKQQLYEELPNYKKSRKEKEREKQYSKLEEILFNHGIKIHLNENQIQEDIEYFKKIKLSDNCAASFEGSGKDSAEKNAQDSDYQVQSRLGGIDSPLKRSIRKSSTNSRG